MTALTLNGHQNKIRITFIINSVVRLKTVWCSSLHCSILMVVSTKVSIYSGGIIIDNKIEIFVGECIGVASEVIALQKVIETIRSAKLNAVIMANVNLCKRQIDLIVALDHTVLVIEAKGYNCPVRGTENGHWKYKPSLGDWRSTGRNYYEQTLGVKHALRGSMSAFTGKNPVDYPEAALIFVPTIPVGSDIPISDFKVKIGDLELLNDFNIFKKKLCWTLDKWREFAKHHNLIKVNKLSAAFVQEVATAEQTVEDYKKSFIETYAHHVEGEVPFNCLKGDETFSSENISSNLANGLILGPSGCGKSLLAKMASLRGLENKFIPLFIEAKYFDKDFGTLLNQEATLLGIQSIKKLFSAIKISGNQLVIILDGLNENSLEQQNRLLRCIRAVSIRQQANIVIISQKSFLELELLKLETIQVPRPDFETKKAIAVSISKNNISSKIDELLGLVSSGLEAKMIGEVGAAIEEETSVYGIFDAYIRHLLGNYSREGINLLTLVGSHLLDNITFSLSIREYDRLLYEYPITLNLSKQLFDSKLLDKHSDKISFGHEFYLNTFSAEALIRACGGDAEAILQAISLPKYENSKTLIIGAIDNTNVLDSILSGIDDVDIIVSCMEGKCGGFAYEWFKNSYEGVLRKISDETASVEFNIDKNSIYGIGVNEDTLIQWTPQEHAHVKAIPQLLNSGCYLEEIYNIAAKMDIKLAATFEILVDKAREEKVALRSGLFVAGLDSQNSVIAIGGIMAWIELARFSNRENKEEALVSWINIKLKSNNITNGQLLMLLKLSRAIYTENPLATYLPSIIQERWKYAPYHLRLELLFKARECWLYTEGEKAELIEVLQSLEVNNIWLSTAIVEALKNLGAIENEGYEEIVISEIEQVLLDPENVDNRKMANGLYISQFDHPYDAVYCKIIKNLSDEKRKVLLSMAVSEKSEYGTFLGCMIVDLGKFGDKRTGKYILHWTDIPDYRHQDQLEAFVVSHIVLGKLQYPLSEKKYNLTDEDNVMMACGELYYLINREDLIEDEMRRMSNQAIHIIKNYKKDLSLGTIMSCEKASAHNDLITQSSKPYSLIDNFSAELREICKSVLAMKIEQRSSIAWVTSKEIYQYAIDVIGSVGKTTDLKILRSFVGHADYGKHAIETIKKIEK